MAETLNNTIQNHVQDTLTTLSISQPKWVVVLAILGAILLISTLCFYLTRATLMKLSERYLARTHSEWVRAARQHRVFQLFSCLIPAIVIYSSAHLLSIVDVLYMPTLIRFIEISSLIYLIIMVTLTLSALINTIEPAYRSLGIGQHYSIKSYLQVIKIALYCLSLILIISTIMQQSPMFFLTGLGAMTAVIMLIFRDSILGFVASIQLSAYDMLRLGDWIEMPNFGADGTVIDISLNTIKVQNFDKTIVTIPSYALLTNGLKNWRGMSESGGRRIKRAFFIDVTTIKFCDNTLLESLKKLPHMQEWLESNKYLSILPTEDEMPVTNISLLRFYLENYLSQHAGIHKKMTRMIRELEVNGKGLPVEIYMFTNDTDWVRYEKIQAEIFDFIYAILPMFELNAFQHLSGSSFALSMPDNNLLGKK